MQSPPSWIVCACAAAAQERPKTRIRMAFGISGGIASLLIDATCQNAAIHH